MDLITFIHHSILHLYEILFMHLHTFFKNRQCVLTLRVSNHHLKFKGGKILVLFILCKPRKLPASHELTKSNSSAQRIKQAES